MKKTLLPSLIITASSVIIISGCSSDKASGNEVKSKPATSTTHTAAPAAVIQETKTTDISSDLDKFPLDIKVNNGKITDIKIIGKDTENYKINKASKTIGTLMALLIQAINMLCRLLP